MSQQENTKPVNTNLKPNNKAITKKSYKGWLIFIGVIILLCGSIFLNKTTKNWFYLTYYYVVKFDHFNYGDKVYIEKNYFSTYKDATAIGFYRLIRPLKDKEIDTILFMSDSKKDSLKHLNKSLENYAINCKVFIDKDSLGKYKTTCVGTYIDHKLLNIKGFDENRKEIIGRVHFYSVKPDKKVLYIDPSPHFYNDEFPRNYTWASDTLYLIPFDLSNKP
ncbi:hypothetical protein [Mucilaginibacter polytrichastri]|uniref:Uncharacterized protein n=1 Tax=Mucilaginibacter polytrichastri TaxID=1302689 RepID=A0A1Q5ZSU9_9SPHI|nr:hypothetical protein [Mucilaginibacter polytrichastri]OKS84844.1 hypothetical protein RG47T_0281 [Mucilaginibacter polytrichastri]SFS48731.1 hypothetical protein SAMN04487890_101793 [Mucilaginibacter polytrichastri]